MLFIAEALNASEESNENPLKYFEIQVKTNLQRLKYHSKKNSTGYVQICVHPVETVLNQ